jgi:hypothetical protein
MTTLYYLQPADEVLSASEILSRVGLDPENTGLVALNAAGVYPVSTTTQPFNVGLFDVTVGHTITNYTDGVGANIDPDATFPWVGQTGDYAVQTWSAADKTLADVIDGAQSSRIKTLVGIIRNRRIAASNNDMSVLASGSDANNYTYWTTRSSDSATALDSELYSISGAATVDAINNIVSAAWGTIALRLDEANPLNLLEGDFDEFYSKNYAESALELYFPSTTTTVAYSTGFAATASAVTAADPTVQIRVAATGVVVDEFELYTADSADFAAEPEGFLKGFGYREYDEETEFSALY